MYNLFFYLSASVQSMTSLSNSLSDSVQLQFNYMYMHHDFLKIFAMYWLAINNLSTVVEDLLLVLTTMAGGVVWSICNMLYKL